MKNYYDWQQCLKKGDLYFGNFEYLEAKSSYSNALKCKNLPFYDRNKCHLRRGITNYHLKGKNYLKEIKLDEKAIPQSSSFEFWFFHVLNLDQSGEYDSALKNIEFNILPHYENKLNEIIIHLSEEMQLIYKMRS